MHPVLFNIGPVAIRPYGVIIAFAFLISFFLLHEEAKRRKFYADRILDLELLILISGIVGARALHVLVNFDFYRKNLADIFLVWKGGLAFYGALIFAVLASWAFIIRKRMPFWETADIIVPYAALGHSIGRIGCFLNGCCFGKYVDNLTYRHPTQIYASLALLGIFVMLKLAGEKSTFSGFIFGFYLILYSLQRFFIDFLRDDNPTYIFGLTISQMISTVVLIAAVLFLFYRRYKKVYRTYVTPRRCDKGNCHTYEV